MLSPTLVEIINILGIYNMILEMSSSLSLLQKVAKLKDDLHARKFDNLFLEDQYSEDLNNYLASTLDFINYFEEVHLPHFPTVEDSLFYNFKRKSDLINPENIVIQENPDSPQREKPCEDFLQEEERKQPELEMEMVPEDNVIFNVEGMNETRKKVKRDFYGDGQQQIMEPKQADEKEATDLRQQENIGNENFMKEQAQLTKGRFINPIQDYSSIKQEQQSPIVQSTEVIKKKETRRKKKDQPSESILNAGGQINNEDGQLSSKNGENKKEKKPKKPKEKVSKVPQEITRAVKKYKPIQKQSKHTDK